MNVRRWVAVIVMLAFAIAVFAGVIAVSATATGDSFFDDLETYDTTRWNKADGWCNPAGFDACWRADHITHTHSIMAITLDDVACSGDCSDRSFSSGEYRTHDPTGSGDEYYGYGCFEVRLKAAAGSGLITSFFTYNGGEWDTPPGGNGLHNEIDIEILGKDTTQMQVNFFANGTGNHEQMVPLGFDAALDFHNYAFKWTDTNTEWYVDGSFVTDTSEPTTPDATPANGGPHKIMMNFWPVDPDYPDLVARAGPFTYTNPLSAEYDWIKYTAGSDCVPAGSGPSAPPGDLSATAVSGTRIDLLWTDNSDNESVFKIERRANGPAGWMEIATVVTDTTTYSDTNLTCGTTYRYRVRAYNENGHSVYSNEAGATTLDYSIYLPLVLNHWPSLPGAPTLNPIP